MQVQLAEAPHVNFFQYPPLQDVGVEEVSQVLPRLQLSVPAGATPFAVFISVPYCRVRCHSCPYFRAILPAHADPVDVTARYLDALAIELKGYARSERLRAAECGAIYIGGGTASLLDAAQVAGLIETLGTTFNLASDVEITLEGNPREFTSEYLRAVKRAGTTRISVGLQSFADRQLKVSLNSPHDSTDSHGVAQAIADSGFRTANFDLLYRVPGQNFDDWRRDVSTLLSYSPQGITTYEYVVHPDTASERMLRADRLRAPVDKPTAFSWYLWARELLTQHGYEEHRMGSFSKPGHEQRYGALAYDQGAELVGAGAGAYSFVNGYQYGNAWTPSEYERLARASVFPVANRMSAKATAQDLMQRFVIFSLFSCRIDQTRFRSRFGLDACDVFRPSFDRLAALDLIDVQADAVELTVLGRMLRRNVMYEFYAPAFGSTSGRRATPATSRLTEPPPS